MKNFLIRKRLMKRSKVHMRGQAMLEFAITLILLLTLIFGIFEVGRLMFVYAAVVTSAREAARYGSVSGRNDAGDLYYQDCAGIRNAAIRVTFFQGLQEDDIAIYYYVNGDDDVSGDPIFTEYCSSGTSVDTSVNLETNDRIRVDVSSNFYPVVPIIPLSNPITIDSSSSRTILGILELE